ncbi:MAG: hypothetical protein WC878_04080 [Candidatus Paceibacterota bacterium]|jgi:hypothetical protein
MEHTEYLKKVTAAKKHEKECERIGATRYYWMTFLGFLGSLIISTISLGPLYSYFSFAIGILGGLLYLYKSEKNKKEFPKKFPEESRLIAEYEELLK